LFVFICAAWVPRPTDAGEAGSQRVLVRSDRGCTVSVEKPARENRRHAFGSIVSNRIRVYRKMDPLLMGIIALPGERNSSKVVKIGI
jgi:hypothetical protein